MKKNKELFSMKKWQFWECTLFAEEKKGELKVFSNAEEEKCYLYKHMMNDEATASEIMRLSFLMGTTNKEEYKDFLDICARYDEENEEGDD